MFEEIGQSLGFGGDFSEYAKPLEEGQEQQAPEAITTERNEAVSGMGKSGQTDGEGTGSASGYTQTKNGIGLISVTKTPFEMIVEAGDNPDTFTVVLDANGEKLENGTFGGACNMLSVSGRDVSKAEVYICDYEEYMDELKGYWYSEEKSSEKSFQDILEERALYHKQIIF